MGHAFVSPIREPLINGHKTYKQISDDICGSVEGPPTRYWLIAISFTALVALIGFATIAYSILYGIGTYGLDRTIGWGWDIMNT